MKELREVNIEDAVPMEYAGTPTDRLTYTMSAVFQHPGDRPVAVQTNFTAGIKNIIQPYERKLVVGTAWKPIDLGWFADTPEKIGAVCFVNVARVGLLVNPTEEEREDLKNQLLLMSFEPSKRIEWIVRPGRPHWGELGSCPAELQMKAADKPVPVRYIIFASEIGNG